MSDQGNWLSTEGEGPGWGRFFLKLAGVVLLIGVAVVIVAFIYARAAYAFGFLGAFLVFALILLLAGWLYDRRQAKSESD